MGDTASEVDIPFRAMAEAMPALVFIAEEDGRNLYVNRRYRDVTGLSDADLLGAPPVPALHPDDRSAMRAAWQRACATGGTFESEYRLRTADGSSRWYLARADCMTHAGRALWVGACVDVDERVRAREAAADAAAQRHLAAEMAGIGGFRFTTRGVIDWTPEMYAVFGIPSGEPVTRERVRALIHPDDLPDVDDAMAALLAGATDLALTYRCRRESDGAGRWIEGRLRALADASGAVTGVQGVARDVTHQREAQAALRESEQRFRALADSAPVMLALADLHGCCTFVSRRWCDFTGQTPAQALGEGWLDAVHPEDRALARAPLADARADAGEHEYRVRRHDGVYRWVLGVSAVRRAPDGSPMGRIGSLIDISDRREAQAALADSEEMLRLAQDAAGVGTFDWDLASDTLRWSDGCKAAFGLAPDEPITFDRLKALIHPGDFDAFLAANAAALDMDGPGTYAIEYRVVWPDGAVRWIDARGRVLSAGQGAARRLTRFLGTVLDVTERKRVEAALAESADMRELLLREVNHRVKNSLQLVTALLTLQGSRLPDGEARAALADAQARVGVVASIHQRLYEGDPTGRVDFGAQGEALTRDLLRAVAADRRVTLRFAAPPRLDLPLAQAVPFTLILNELVTNAAKYAWPGRDDGRLDVALARADGLVTLTVADDGPGLPPDPAGAGGLGGRLVRSLARQLRGRMDVLPGPGARLRLTFPDPAQPPGSSAANSASTAR